MTALPGDRVHDGNGDKRGGSSPVYELRLIYAERPDSTESFSWYRGQVLSAGQRAERIQVHQEISDIARHSRREQRLPWGRGVLSRDRKRILVDIELTSVTGVQRSSAASIVIAADWNGTSWAHPAAQESAVILGIAGFDVTAETLESAFSFFSAAKTSSGQCGTRIQAPQPQGAVAIGGGNSE